MVKRIEEWLTGQWDITQNTASMVSIALVILGIIIVCLIVDRITKRVILRGIKKFVHKTENTLDEILYQKKVFHNLAHIAPAVIVYLTSQWFQNSEMIQKVVYAYILLIIGLTAFKLLDVVVEVYRTKEFSKSRPIKGLIQVVKIGIAIFGAIFIIAIFIGDATAWALLSGVGGMSAIIILIFKDSILGLVAGIQLSANNQLRIGDWIEMSKFGADGEVVDISLTNITVSNWDKTLTNIPAYKFIDESFKNWQGMSEAGGRRIKRALYIDMSSIRFMDEALTKRLKKVELLTTYLNQKEEEITVYNKEHNMANTVNGRGLTNIGTFRAYVLEYLKANAHIHQDYTLLVRQLAPTNQGLPIEVYCFTNDTAWANYEGIMADIFDHLLAVLEQFDLRVYQNPTGHDFKKITN